MQYTTKTTVAKDGTTLLLTLPEWPERIEEYDMAAEVDALERVYDEARVLMDTIARERPATWEGLNDRMEEISERASRISAPLKNLYSAMRTPAMKDAFQRYVAASAKFGNDVIFHTGYFEATRAFAESDAYRALAPERRRSIDLALRNWKLAGTDLPEADRERLRALNLELAELSRQFEENETDAENEWVYLVTDADRLRGVPADTVATMAAEAKERGLEGFAAMAKDSMYVDVMRFAEDRELRKEVFIARSTAASDSGPLGGKYDNRPILERILHLRKEAAEIRGARSHAEIARRTKMYQDPLETLAIDRRIAGRIKSTAEKEFDALRTFARDKLGLEAFAPWDSTFAAEKLRKERFEFSEDEVKPYFTATRSLEGVFAVAKKLYGITFRERTDSVRRWHPSVRFFEVYDKSGDLRAAFYVDLYARTGALSKRGGAWADTCMMRLSREGGIQLPVGLFHLNANPPSGGRDAQLSHGDFLTVFHEFGHCLHHMLGKPTLSETSWGGVEWDAIELPSQVMENFGWLPEVMRGASAHAETGMPIPDDLIAKIIAGKHFLEALALIRQIELGMIDMLLHLGDPAEKGFVERVISDVRREVRVTPVYVGDRFPNTFGHIFAGGYAAGYVDYILAEMLSSDSYEMFLEAGDPFDEGVAEKFLSEFLEPAGTRSAKESYLALRGRLPNEDALLRQRGLA